MSPDNAIEPRREVLAAFLKSNGRAAQSRRYALFRRPRICSNNILLWCEMTGRVEIEYCTQCRWLLRAAWMAQELLTTFETDLAEVALIPGRGGIFDVRLDGVTIFSRKKQGRFPESKELKQLIRDRIAPEKDLAHSDRH